MFNFDRSIIPGGSDITKVEFKPIDAPSQPVNPPNGIRVYIGNFINGSLDGNAGEFNGGTLMITNTTMISGTWYDLSAGGKDPTVFFSDASGETDIAIRGQWDGVMDRGHNYNDSGGHPPAFCQLRVTYIPPGLTRTLVGVGL